MNITKAQLKAQYNRAKKLGWLPFFDEAVESYTKGYFDSADLLGIASRETNLDPKWLTKRGDGGNAGGLLQIDIRSFPDFVKNNGWHDARIGILFGAQVLMQKWHDFERNVGKTLSVKNYHYVAEAAYGATAQHIVLSSYNCGRWSQYAYSKQENIDKYSTGHDYGDDVMQRAAIFRELLAQEKDSAAEQKDAFAKVDSTNPQDVLSESRNDAAQGVNSGSNNLEGEPDNQPEQNTAANRTPAPSTDSTRQQTAEVINNVNSSDSAPKIEAAKDAPDTNVDSHTKTGFLAKISGVAVAIATGQYVLPSFLQSDSFLSALVKAIEGLFHGLFVLRYFVFGSLALWFVTKKIEAFMTKIEAMKINSDPTKGTVNVVAPAPKASVFNRFYEWLYGVKN